MLGQATQTSAIDPPPLPRLIAAHRLVRRVAMVLGGVAAGCGLALGLGAVLPRVLGGAFGAGGPWRAVAAGLPAGVMGGAVVVALAGVAGTLALTRARIGNGGAGAGRAARWPQVLIVPALGAGGAALAWARHGVAAVEPAGAYLLAGAAALVSFLLLLAERAVAAEDPRVLPEGPPLAALLRLATLATFGAALVTLGAGLGIGWTPQMAAGLALVVELAGAELALRALGRGFLPAPAAEAARAACASAVASAVAGAAARGPAGHVRRQFGIDFSRSWALSYARRAALPVGGFVALLGWGLSGLSLVPIDRRAVQLRFGAPVAVWGPGLHAGLPWPLGRGRFVEYGPVHEIGLAAAPEALERAPAEATPPAGADRLWEQAHPAEVVLLIASNTNGRESFETVSADLRVLWRAGLTDAAALRMATATADPEALVRASAGRVVAAYFAPRTLDQVLGANREAMAATLRDQLQAAMDAAGSGIEAVAVSVEAIHPPAGAADAYHNVRAAEINARASIAVEHGSAATLYAQSRQYAVDQTTGARAAAAERVSGAGAAETRFAADQAAARAGGQAFLLERYLGALSTALGRTPKTIVDHRLNWPEAPVLDLRPPGPPGASGPMKEE